ncbi:hypothetical protein PtA15_17A22 [Puccinia triticina]|uniref:Uncharacterized protein n=1 Tax=Puccinia triticina TaxID=208348 RepID=A0ABY7D4I9_9BASI|nr:uncharacterized protein PtA15_17A22 [Puccinia triticina]WAQ92541.1 hypothetical protein PtA15_17A22 [Puccinia triticina]
MIHPTQHLKTTTYNPPSQMMSVCPTTSAPGHLAKYMDLPQPENLIQAEQSIDCRRRWWC